jgi:hypothetical protein
MSTNNKPPTPEPSRVHVPQFRNLLDSLTRVRHAQLSDPNAIEPPPLSELQAHTSRELERQLHQLNERPPELNQDLIDAAELRATHDLQAERDRVEFTGDNLLETLGVRMGAITPTQARAKKRRRRIKTPADVMRAIAEVNTELLDNLVDAKVARTRLYALQTLLVAMRMQQEVFAPGPGEPLQLSAVAAADTAPSTATALADLQRRTREEDLDS